MTELATTQTVTLVHPQTGEVLDLQTAESGQIAQWIDSVAEWQSSAREAKNLAYAELHRRMDQAAVWTLHEDGFVIRGESPDRTEYDVDALRERLAELVAYGVVTPPAAEAAVKTETTYKPAKRGINALLKLGGQVAEAIRSCEVEVTRPRRITVKRG